VPEIYLQLDVPPVLTGAPIPTTVNLRLTDLETQVGLTGSLDPLTIENRLTVAQADIITAQDTADTHIADLANPHVVTATQVGLGNCDDTSLTLNRIVSAASDLVLECYKTPSEMVDDADEPEIAPRHHRKLAGWVKFRAYSVPDTDFFDVKRSSAGLSEFEDYFGRRKDVNYRRDNNSNRPHRVKVCV
jgi:hypothetical protein